MPERIHGFYGNLSSLTEGHMMFPYGLYVFLTKKSNAAFAVMHNLKEGLGKKNPKPGGELPACLSVVSASRDVAAGGISGVKSMRPVTRRGEFHGQ